MDGLDSAEVDLVSIENALQPGVAPSPNLRCWSPVLCNVSVVQK